MRQTIKTAWVIGILILCIVSILESLPAQAAGNPKNGKAIYEKHCVHCHGSQGKGDGPTGKLLNPPATDFTGIASKKKTEADLRKMVENGKPGTAMASWKEQLTEAGMADVLAYLIMLRK